MFLYFFHTWTNLCKNRGVYSTSLLTVSVLVLSTFIFISRHLLHFSVQYPIIVFSTNVIAEKLNTARRRLITKLSLYRVIKYLRGSI